MSLFLLFRTLATGESPVKQDPRSLVASLVLRGGTCLGTAVALFFIGTTFLGTPVSGLALGLLGWFLPHWIEEVIASRRQAKLRALARDFITSAAGLYSGNQTTIEVVRLAAERFGPPFGREFEDMVAQNKFNRGASFKQMFEAMGEKYGLDELRAVGHIIAASEIAGGPQAAARGLKRLGEALRQRDKQLSDRKKGLFEPLVAGVVALLGILAGLVLDVTIARPYFDGAGRWILTASTVLMVGMAFAVMRLSSAKDLLQTAPRGKSPASQPEKPDAPAGRRLTAGIRTSIVRGE
ncbi:MAG: type II secretion system F family protein [Thermoanaerobacterales bacterium]|nr:type II secretion system F family protein [Thermoanaerobacterales bacterium]